MKIPKITIREFDSESIDEYMEQIKNFKYSFDESQPLFIEIDSYGGSVPNCFRLLSELNTVKNKKITYTHSKAISCGFLLLSSGTPGFRFASEDSDIMVHEISSGAVGNVADIQNRIENIEHINKHFCGKIKKFTKISNLRRAVKKNANGADWFMTAEEALHFGVIDHIGLVNIKKEFTLDIK